MLERNAFDLVSLSLKRAMGHRLVVAFNVFVGRSSIVDGWLFLLPTSVVDFSRSSFKYK